MKGIKVFLVLQEGIKDVCYFEFARIEYCENTRYSIYDSMVGNKWGYSLIGKIEDKKDLINRLIAFRKGELNMDRESINYKLRLLDKLEDECDNSPIYECNGNTICKQCGDKVEGGYCSCFYNLD